MHRTWAAILMASILLVAGAMHAVAAFGSMADMRMAEGVSLGMASCVGVGCASDPIDASAAAQCVSHCLASHQAVPISPSSTMPLILLFAAAVLSVSLLPRTKVLNTPLRRFSDGVFRRRLLHLQLATVMLRD